MGYHVCYSRWYGGKSITAIDGTLIKAKGSVWHKSSMEKGVVPRPGIDTDARWWGYSHTTKDGFWIQITSYIDDDDSSSSSSSRRDL